MKPCKIWQMTQQIDCKQTSTIQKWVCCLHKENMFVTRIPPQTPLFLAKLEFGGVYLIFVFEKSLYILHGQVFVM